MSEQIKTNSHNYDFSKEEIDEAYKKSLDDTEQQKTTIIRIGFFYIGVPLAFIWNHLLNYWPLT